jgi:serine phosphatase RsbU (regulator of sigma subunit)
LKIRIEARDSVLFFTDGLSDAFDTNGDSFGIERLPGICEGSRQSSPTELLGRVFSEVERFAQGQPQHDDMAAAVFRCCDA